MIEQIQDAELMPVERPKVPPFPESFVAFACWTEKGWSQVGSGWYQSIEEARDRIGFSNGIIASRIVRVPGDGGPSEVQRLRAALQEIADGKWAGAASSFARQVLGVNDERKEN